MIEGYGRPPVEIEPHFLVGGDAFRHVGGQQDQAAAEIGLQLPASAGHLDHTQ